ncbi:glycoside hydrolase family 3 C-terminal domain-containing protein [Tuanshanicoccus lijuaniae]|uniref:glycoside hydrolase family 3 N-terminal domain-containing protein n=1 Tax=Aerococcaceae bacterium zg-1292 TaxID=2774330 RepID=UPI0019377FD0|nr:glycoside hydrolase family 3 C-terminal domain-containing protein [Aerococcaceae bacterium zg-1292]MBS4456420.1 glycoside hydrolase family 3 C-terminal domain-containing protein [Aerococcaceae bacterium zg-A91]MBS4458270.1 glycoside hydrolase family 3 C-terminal domain-containing protein [Aerococcaceae bacterium zg-BR33]QQA37498.1 glycoside hydrolase family 3 C-terminal domain-containing protein [Aerococcaceae bacterium zg-1292]
MKKYLDSNLSVTERVEDLISRMTLEEKVAQLCGNLPNSIAGREGVKLEELKKVFPDGHGRITQASILGINSAKKLAEYYNKVQKYFVEETRLGIPVVFQSESLCGLPIQSGTVFPSQMNLGYTWEPELAEEMTKIISEECRAVGITSTMSPVIDVSRDLRWGRTYETYGEDEYLISQMGVSYINGMQKEKENGVACIAKHFLGYAETQGGLNIATTRVNDRELYEVFATPFEAAIKKSDVAGMMANYSEIDGLNVVVNKKIATNLLRDVMGFDGFLTSDGAAILKTYNTYKIASTYEEAGLMAIKAGTDTEIPVGDAFKNLPNYVRSGHLDEAVIDQAVKRVLKIKFEYGLFENPYVDISKLESKLNNNIKNEVSEKIAQKSMVLLTNDGSLPLARDKSIALIGPHANSLRYSVSGYTYPAYIEMLLAAKNSEDISLAGIADMIAKGDETASSADDSISDFDNIDEVLRMNGGTSLFDEISKTYQVEYVEGCSIMGKDKSQFSKACEIAKNSDVIIFAGGGNCGWTKASGGEGVDRSSLDLPGVQQELLEELYSLGKPIILVLYGPGLFSLPWAKENVSAILQASMPGLQAGKVVADCISGVINPGGKLTQTIPRSVGQIPVYYNHRTGSGYVYNEAIDAGPYSLPSKGGYVNEDDQPLFEFGHGLSYTNFELSDMKIVNSEISTDGTIEVSCKITNVGEVSGDEVIQLYYRMYGAHVIRPVQQLCGFKRVSLLAKETKQVLFSVPCSLFGYYNEDMNFVIEPNQVEMRIGTSAHHIHFKQKVNLIGDTIDLHGKRSYSSEVQIMNS